MRWIGGIELGSPVIQGRFTTFWQGILGATPVTWTQRNIGSLTDNGAGDTTFTFQQAYQATPCVVGGAGEEAAAG